MTAESLIEALTKAARKVEHRGINNVWETDELFLSDAIAIVREHQTAPKQYFTSGGEFITEVQVTMVKPVPSADVVERVAKAIAPVRHSFYRNSSKVQPNYADQEMAKAAIAAIQDYGGARTARTETGTVAPAKLDERFDFLTADYQAKRMTWDQLVAWWEMYAATMGTIAELPIIKELAGRTAETLNAQADEIASLKHDIEQSLVTNAELATENERLRGNGADLLREIAKEPDHTRPKEEESIREAVGREWLETKVP
jgi:hypothetical protein